MPTYIMLSHAHPRGRPDGQEQPARIREVNSEVEQLGATVKAQWATLGHFDFINVVEAPDEKTMARVSLELGSRGTGALRVARRDPDRRLHRRPVKRGSSSSAAGGREHAIVRALLRSPQAPGGAVRARQRRASPRRAAARRAADDPAALAAAARDAGVDLVVVGPEAPLVAGARRRAAPPPACAASARPRPPRGSRARRRSPRRSWPPPASRPRRTRSSTTSRRAWPRSPATRPCIKADGLAAGKGVVIAADEAEARAALEDDARRAPLRRRRRSWSRSSSTGDELSLLALCDGERALPLAPARDYKRIGDGDTGPNTGGMGASRPVAGIDDALRRARSRATSTSRSSTSSRAAARRSTASSTPG